MKVPTVVYVLALVLAAAFGFAAGAVAEGASHPAPIAPDYQLPTR